jgi:chemotaxis protein CheX
MNADYINPFLLSTASVFEQMLGMELVREAPFIRKAFSPQYEVTGIIGLTGKTTGTVAVSLPREMALSITEKLLGERPPDVNAQVIDAIGEVTNMIAGSAKSRLEHLQLSLGLPTVVTGCSTCIGFPSRATPISIPFRSPLGPIVVEVGILA